MRKPLAVILVFVTASIFGACRADDVVKQGIEGEFCNNRDDDCREGHICQDGICRALEGSGSITCAEMCQRLDECQSGETNCEADCRATIQGTCDGTPCPWSPEAVDAFGMCITEDLTCDEIREVDAPQECYRRIPIDTDRETRCEAFIAAADRCNSAAATSELRNRCYLLGRTNTAESWERTDPCVDRIDDGLCGEIEDCFNSVFELDPAIELGDGQLQGDGDPDVEPVNNGVPG
jgi:hypothetical protein